MWKKRAAVVNFMCLSAWLGHGAQIFSQTVFWMFPVKVFLDEMNSEISALGAKQIALPRVGGRWASHYQMKS